MTSLIQSVAIRNFKGISDEVKIGIRPITLLFGPNSSGKSSVLQALQYLLEVLERNNTNPDRTILGGLAVDLGGFRNLVHGRDLEREIEIEVGLRLGDTALPDLTPEAFDDFAEVESDVFDFYAQLDEIRRAVDLVSVRISVGWSEMRSAPLVTAYTVSINGDWFCRITSSSDGRDAQMRINGENPVFMRPCSTEELDALAALDALDWAEVEEFGAPSEGEETSGSTVQPPSSFSILPQVLETVRNAGLEKPGAGLRAWLDGLRGALPRLNRLLSIPAPGAGNAQDIYIAREFTAFLSAMVIGPAVLLREQLQRMRYLGPLRTIPQRQFETRLSRVDSAWADGTAAWETLLTGSPKLVSDCSVWLQSRNCLGTGYGVRRREFHEVDVESGVEHRLGNVRRRLELMDDEGMPHQPMDVGVGISQVLPVIVAALEDDASLVAIEQPELHIHPAVQVGLGDLFLEGALNRGLSFLIETHSEHLILRLLRRIREAGEEGQTTVNPDCVGVFCLDRGPGGLRVTEVRINREGEFDTPWPQGFFDERGEELFG